ncbi:hypothetical protein [Schleiferilactobacillus perolens]|uniref:Uncharacterized protein n=1 Tax=Schleiferilactobacillus perolens DSM 12744 TaxID=1423792 RepID=A0A0R1MW95_9LACO|nr:hypothetical protein [Schleiferilactobacillus perolens]KRL12399.1 hypothetical protein FD09_GL002981 [Schleiferilactobacillus perolens DSM 12744]
MATKTNQLIEENNTLREQLTPANKKYYEDLLLYMRTKEILKDDAVIEQELLTILTDIIAAQQDGVSAVDYFGKQPQETADDILAEVPTHWFSVLKMIGSVLLGYVLITAIPALTIPTSPVDIGTEIITGLYFTMAAFVIVTYIGRTTYKKQHEWGRLGWIIRWLLACVFIAPGFLLSFFLKTPWRIYLTGFIGIALICVLLVITGVIFWRENDKTIWWPFVPIVLIMALIGIVTRIPSWQAFLLNTDPGRIGLAVALGVALIVFYVLIWMLFRRTKREH